MANPVPAGSDVSAGTYQCTNCGNEIEMGSQAHIPPCPQCRDGEWETVTGGDSVHDPYPDRDLRVTRLRWIVLAWVGRKVWSTWRRRRAAATRP